MFSEDKLAYTRYLLSKRQRSDCEGFNDNETATGDNNEIALTPQHGSEQSTD